MKEEKHDIRKSKIFYWLLILGYLLFVAVYFLGRKVGSAKGLEYRFWVDATYRILVWFVPVVFIGIMLLKACMRYWKKKRAGRWILAAVFVCYGGIAVYLSFLYVLFGAFTLTSDEEMPDGNLVIAVPNGMESFHHYAEPVGLFFRRNISFDEVRTADSLSKIYGVSFQPQKMGNDEWVYVSDAYPAVEVANIRYGYTKTSYLDNDFNLALTSKILEEHREIFTAFDVELVSYVYGQTEENPDGWGPYTSVLVSEEKVEDASKAIAEFIKVTLQEDLRADGKSCWERVDGSIFVVIRSEEDGEYISIRNIPFSLKPEYSWIFDENVTDDDIAGKIAKNLDLYQETEAIGNGSIEAG